MNFRQLNLQVGDKIVIPKSDFNLIQHHVIYLGYWGGGYWIAENQFGTGVCIRLATDFFENLSSITRIERFNGSSSQRAAAVKKALSLKGMKYDLINFNCEHYSNMVLHGRAESPQITNVFILTILAVTAWGIFKS